MSDEQLIVVSPHFDDAVLACGQWLAQRPDSLVVTVFAAIPDDFDGVTAWDADCGFASSREALRARQAEDNSALELLACRSLRLPFCDAQYGAPADPARIAGALSEIFAALAPATIAAPLGLFHSDHVLAREATLLALRQHAEPRARIVLYEDVPYRTLPEATDTALAALRAGGVGIGEMQERADAAALERKRLALACYASQLRGLSTPGRAGTDDALAPERCWPITLPAPACVA